MNTGKLFHVRPYREHGCSRATWYSHTHRDHAPSALGFLTAHEICHTTGLDAKRAGRDDDDPWKRVEDTEGGNKKGTDFS